MHDCQAEQSPPESGEPARRAAAAKSFMRKMVPNKRIAAYIFFNASWAMNAAAQLTVAHLVMDVLTHGCENIIPILPSFFSIFNGRTVALVLLFFTGMALIPVALRRFFPDAKRKTLVVFSIALTAICVSQGMYRSGYVFYMFIMDWKSSDILLVYLTHIIGYSALAAFAGTDRWLSGGR